MILTRIVKDAVVYFSVIFGSQLIVECFILFAPVSHCAGLDRIPQFFCVSWVGGKFVDSVLWKSVMLSVKLPTPSSDVRVPSLSLTRRQI